MKNSKSKFLFLVCYIISIFYLSDLTAQTCDFSDEVNLFASDAFSQDFFGGSVSVSGNRAIVGANSDDDNGSSSGSIYIYEKMSSIWEESIKLTASDGASSDYFGSDVSVLDDRVVVGAFGDDDSGSSSGAAYVYDYDGTNWVETKLTASDGAANDNFGSSVSVSNDRVIIGSKNDDSNGSNSGAVYVYDYDGTTWIETKIIASDGAMDDKYGANVSVEDDRIIVGAFGDDDNGGSSGSSYVYDYDGTTWIETKLTASDGAVSDFFGWSVSVSGDFVAIGTPYDDDIATASGSVYIFEFDGTTWLETKLLPSVGGDANDNYGISVSISGEQLLTGANGDFDYRGSIYFNTCVSCTNLLTPVDGSVDVPIDAMLNWTSLSEATGYKISIGTSSGGVDILDNQNVGNVTSYDPGDFSYGDTIYVVIIPIFANGDADGCIEESFVIDANLPDCTTLTNPVNGQSDVDLNSILTWNSSVEAIGYTLLIYVAGGDTILNNLDVGDVLVYNPGLFPPNKIIYTKIIPYNIQGDAIGCTTESFTTNLGVLFSGTMEYPNGDPNIGLIKVFDSNTYKEVINFSAGGSNATFAKHLAPGTYNVYYRPFQIGAQSYEIFNLDLTSDLDTVLLLSPYSSSDYFEEAYWSDLAIFGEGTDSVSIQAKINSGYNIDSIFWYRENTDLNSDLPYKLAKYKMMDDGLNEDLVAGDGTYSSIALYKDIASIYDRSNALSTARAAYFQVFEGNSPTSYKSLSTTSLGIVNSTATTTTPFVQWNDTIFTNNHLINIVSESLVFSASTAPSTVVNLIYDIYPDSFDLINIYYLESSSQANLHWDVSNNVSGIGQSIFDNSSSFGSNGRLKGINTFPSLKFSYPTHHESMHQWGNNMSIFNGGNYGSHNAYSSIDGFLGGMRDPTIINSTTITSFGNSPLGNSKDIGEFADMELYMMGVLDTAELRNEYIITSVDTWDPPVKIGDGVGGAPDTFQVSYVLSKSPQDIVTEHGYRNPAPTDTVTVFRTATVVITSEPMGEAVNMYYTFLARVWEGSQVEDVSPFSSYLSFDEATQFRANMITKLPSPKCDPILTLTGTIPSGSYQAGVKIIVNGNPASNAVLNLDAPKVEIMSSTNDTGATINIVTPTGCDN